MSHLLERFHVLDGSDTLIYLLLEKLELIVFAAKREVLVFAKFRILREQAIANFWRRLKNYFLFRLLFRASLMVFNRPHVGVVELAKKAFGAALLRQSIVEYNAAVGRLLSGSL
jgi:hypothetical protein